MKNKSPHKRSLGLSSQRVAPTVNSETLLQVWRALIRGRNRCSQFAQKNSASKIVKSLFVLGLMSFSIFGAVFAAEPASIFITGTFPNIVEPKRLSSLLETIFVLTFISLVPSFLIMTTSFLRMVIVMSFLRHALGTQQTPPNSVLISLAIVLTLFVMTPTWKKVNDVAISPYQQKLINWKDAVTRGALPLQEFMMRQVRKKDLSLVVSLANVKNAAQPNDLPFTVVATAFALSELKTAFEIGFLIFIPFLVIDLIVASVLMALGMMMVPPSTISLPLKILLFVLVDGWNLLVQGLVQSVRM